MANEKGPRFDADIARNIARQLASKPWDLSGTRGTARSTCWKSPPSAEIHDNIVAFWRPKDTLRTGSEYTYTYRLHWTWDAPLPPTLSRTAQTRWGGTEARRLFVASWWTAPSATPPR